MNVQYWRISGYEATADIPEEQEKSWVAVGDDQASGERVVLRWDEALHRWQQVEVVDSTFGPISGGAI